MVAVLPAKLNACCRVAEPLKTAGRGWMAALLLVVALPVAPADRFLPAEEAFRMSVERIAQDRVALRFDIAPGYYMYRASLSVQADGVAVGPLDTPPGVVKFDENFGKDVETYHGTLRVGVVLQGAPDGPVILAVQSQGCAEAGLCYPVSTTRVQLEAPGRASATPPSSSTGSAVLAHAPSGAASADAAYEASSEQGGGGTWRFAALLAAAAAVVAFVVWRVRRRSIRA